MRISENMAHRLWCRIGEPTIQRIPDEIIGHKRRWRATQRDAAPVERPFLLRWFVNGEKRRGMLGCNAYIHQFIRDDDDRALHDHPWWNLSILLGGQYIEHTIDAGGVHRRQLYKAGDMKLRSPTFAHRVELTHGSIAGGHMNGTPYDAPFVPNWVTVGTKDPAWSLFLTGPTQRLWGFHCAEGWRGNKQFGVEGCAHAFN